MKDLTAWISSSFTGILDSNGRKVASLLIQAVNPTTLSVNEFNVPSFFALTLLEEDMGMLLLRLVLHDPLTDG